MGNNYRSVLASGGVQPTGDAVAADVLTGKTFSNANAVGISGTMPNNGAVSGTATPSQPYRIPAGYHNGSGVVRAVSGAPRQITATNISSGNNWSFTLPNLTVGSKIILICNMHYVGTGFGTPTISGGTLDHDYTVPASTNYGELMQFVISVTASTMIVSGSKSNTVTFSILALEI